MDFIYGKCIILLIFIIILILCSLLFWELVYLIKKNHDYKNFSILTINVIYETLYSNLVNYMAKSITCTRIGSESYNSQNMYINCSDDGFIQWVCKPKISFKYNFFCLEKLPCNTYNLDSFISYSFYSHSLFMEE